MHQGADDPRRYGLKPHESTLRVALPGRLRIRVGPGWLAIARGRGASPRRGRLVRQRGVGRGCHQKNLTREVSNWPCRLVYPEPAKNDEVPAKLRNEARRFPAESSPRSTESATSGGGTPSRRGELRAAGGDSEPRGDFEMNRPATPCELAAGHARQHVRGLPGGNEGLSRRLSTRWADDVPHQPDPLPQPDHHPGHVEFPPPMAVSGGALVGVVIVVPAFAEGQ